MGWLGAGERLDGCCRLDDRFFDLGCVDIEVGDHAQGAGDGCACEYTTLGEGVLERGPLDAIEAEERHVGVDGLRVDDDAGDLGEALGKSFRVRVILGKSVYVIFERVERGGSDGAWRRRPGDGWGGLAQ